MDQDGTWGSDIELLCFAHLCKTCVFSYSKEMGNWDRYGPHNVDRTITVRVCDKSIYLFHPAGHYDLVGSTVKVPKNVCNEGTKSDAHKVKHENVTNGEDWVSVSHNIQVWHDLRFHSVDVQWQLEKCTLLNVPFCCPNNLQPGGPNVALTRPILTKSIYGDGNCLFRCFSYIITGSQEHHMAVRSALVDHMVSIPAVFGGNVEDYLAHTNMNRSGTWGTLKKCLGCLIC